MERVFRILVWSIFGFLIALLVVALISGADVALPALLAMGAIATTLLVLIVIAQPPRLTRRRRARVILTYLEQAVRLNLPLPQYIQAASRTESATTAMRLRQLARALEAGPSIALAVDQAVPEMSPRTLALLRAAESSGQLPVVLDRLVQEDALRQRSDPLDQAFVTVYPPLMCIAVVGIWWLILTFVMPKFEMIFKDFHVALPLPTQWMLRVSNVFADQPWLLLIILMIAVASFGWTWLPRQVSFNWLPLGWLMRNRELEDVCQTVGDACRASIPLPEALDSAAHLHVSRSLRRQLRRWVDEITAGNGAADAARAAELPPLICNLVGGDSDAMADTFAFLARYYRSRFSRTIEIIRGGAIPLFTFAFAVQVAWLALSLILPMARLIDTVGPYRSSF